MGYNWIYCGSLLLCVGLVVAGDSKWSYSGSHGPQYWHELFKHQCSGSKQSPIDIRAEQTLYDPSLKDFAIWYDPPKPDSKILVKNNGHALQVDLEGDFFVTNGGLNNVYKAAQFHFHWGHKSHHGSEHTMDGTASPIEMHLVTYNSDLYNHIGEAVQERGGLAVLGVMFEISEEDNPAFDAIVKASRYVRDPEEKLRIKIPVEDISIRNLLPADISRYYRYHGSLTTPGCFESVIWTVFEHKQTISRAQLKEFRALLQLRRHHHHNKHSKSGETRHRRSLTRDEMKKENNAKDALLELGIKDNQREEAFLRDATIKHNERMAKLTEQPTTKNIEVVAIDQQTADGMATKTTHEEPAFTQDQLVNNYRPVQPLNDRVVKRSFKLRDPVVVSRDGTAQMGSQSDYNVKASTTLVKGEEGKAPCDGATSIWSSMLVMFVSLMISFVFVH